MSILRLMQYLTIQNDEQLYYRCKDFYIYVFMIGGEIYTIIRSLEEK
jgi:hypothetical protein